MNLLLKLKAWHLFLLLIVLELIYEQIPQKALFQFVGMLIWIGWMYSVGSHMNKLIPEKSRPSITYFQSSCLFIILIYIITYLTQEYITNEEFLQIKDYKLFLFILLGLYTTWSMLYIFSYAARMLESVIKGEFIGISDSLKAFFCFWFFPIGIWFIQPTVNRIIEKHFNEEIITN